MSGDISFDKAAFETPVATECARCKSPLTAEYFALGPHAICGACREAFLSTGGNPAGRLMLAAALGLGAAILGCLLYWGVLVTTGYEVGLIAIAVGLGVGRAVRYGSGERGGLVYQILAVYLTYISIGASYVVSSVGAILETANPISAVLTFAYFAHIAPFLGFDPIGLLIIGFGLLQAWRMTASRVPHITGPYMLGAPAPNG